MDQNSCKSSRPRFLLWQWLPLKRFSLKVHRTSFRPRSSKRKKSPNSSKWPTASPSSSLNSARLTRIFKRPLKCTKLQTRWDKDDWTTNSSSRTGMTRRPPSSKDKETLTENYVKTQKETSLRAATTGTTATPWLAATTSKKWTESAQSIMRMPPASSCASASKQQISTEAKGPPEKRNSTTSPTISLRSDKAANIVPETQSFKAKHMKIW